MSTAASVEGINAGPVTDWLAARAQIEGPLRFELITGGRSNLTYQVSDAAGSHWILRRPPLGHVLATAHDMSRESSIMAALAGTDVPVPHIVGLCTDDSVNGAPFFMMDFVSGKVLRDRATAETLSLPARAAASAHLVEVLAAIHAVDPDEVGLGELGRRDGYVARQLKRWHGQWEKSAYTGVTAIDDVHKRLSAKIPDQIGSTIVHGDYRLDNCILSDEGEIAAVLDWELCTLGDPLADVGLLLVYWAQAGDGFAALPDAPTTAEGFSGRDELIRAYGAASGRDVRDIDYYVALGYWKLACILAGVATRYAAGAMGSGDAHELAELFGAQLELLVAAAAEAAERSGR